MSERKLSGKVAVITGGARGLGRGYALRLAGLGADIAIIDRNLRGAEVYEFERTAMTAATVMAECEDKGGYWQRLSFGGWTPQANRYPPVLTVLGTGLAGG